MRKFTNFFNLFLSIVFFFLISNITLAQQDTLVKRSYTDSVHAATTVVVKNNSANDFDILNSQFGNSSFNDVIFIKTENLTSSKPKSERTSFEDVIKETNKPTPKPVSKSIVKNPSFSKSQPLSGSNAQQTAQIKDKDSKPKTTNRKVLYFNRSGFINPKMKKKKLKKRKRVKRGKSNRCYQF